jgi:hypothetical protein
LTPEFLRLLLEMAKVGVDGSLENAVPRLPMRFPTPILA